MEFQIYLHSTQEEKRRRKVRDKTLSGILIENSQAIAHIYTFFASPICRR